MKRTYAPHAAVQAQSDKLVPIAVVRGDERMPLAAGARVEEERVVLSSERVHVHKLAPGDVIEEDAEGRIVAVRSAATPPMVIRFVPGTAESPNGSDTVRGQIAGDSRTLELQSGDSIEMQGRLAPDDALPGGGHVESTRATGALVGGVILLVLSYAPTAYVGIRSSRTADRVLDIPVAGPWIDLTQRSACVAPQSPVKPPIDPCLEETASRVTLVASGVLQGIGMLLTVVGLPARAQLVDGGDRGVGLALVPTAGGAAAIGSF